MPAGADTRFAVVGAVTAIELITRYMLVEPLLQGAFVSESWAILTKHIIRPSMGRSHASIAARQISRLA
jgi:hypothetical protein